MTPKAPIVIVAFGTTTAALDTYRHLNDLLQRYYAGHEIRWAYTSRIVRDRLQNRFHTSVNDPVGVLKDLHAKGHPWAVVQSLHLICGHEYYRLVEDVKGLPLRTSIGLPLLSCPADYQRVAFAIGMAGGFQRDEALVLVGHGTDHPAWTAYPALETMVKRIWNARVHVGVIDGHPGIDEVLQEIIESGVAKVRMVPFLLVAGTHFIEDLSQGENCWKAVFERHGLEVALETRGLGHDENIVAIFASHIGQALDVIPAQDRQVVA